MLLVVQLPGKLLADRVLQIAFAAEAAQLVEQLGGQLGHLQLLDFQHLEDRGDPLAAERHVRRVVAQLGLALPRLAGRERPPSACRTAECCRRGSSASGGCG